MAAAAATAATAAAPVAGVGAAPAVPPARLGANPGDTSVSRYIAVLSASDPDELMISVDSPVVTAFPFLQWVLPPPGGRTARVPMSELQGICITACNFNLADPTLVSALRGANLVESGLSSTACSAVLHELHDARLLEEPYDGEADFWEALIGSPLVNQTALACQPGWVEAYDTFDVPGTAAVPGVPATAGRRGQPARLAVPAVPASPATPGPQSLKFLQLTTWFAVLSEGSRQLSGMGARLLGRAHSLLSHRARDATRRDGVSDVQSIAITLATYVGSWAGLGTSATAAQIARHAPSHLASCMSVVPSDLAGPCGTTVACEAELRDGQILLRGRESEAVSVLWSRIHSHLRRFPVIGLLDGRLSNSGATKDILERLMIGMNIPSGSPLVRTWELARDLERKGKMQSVRDLLAAGSTVSQVVEEILDSHVTTAGAAAVPDSGVNAPGELTSSAASFASSGSMEQREFERAVTSPNFIVAYETMKSSEGYDVIDAAATSGSVLMLRFLFAAPAWMRPRHAAFDLLGKHLADRGGYLAYCATLSSEDGIVPRHYSTYRLADTQADLFWSCRWSEMDMVNANPQIKHEGGFLALRYLENGTQYSGVSKSDFYTVESSLLGIRDWFSRLLLGVGFSPTPGDGYSWTDVVDRQLDFIRYINGLPATERVDWQAWAGENFVRHALCRAETLFKARLVTSRPADEAVDAFLPDGAAFFSNITSKLDDARPIAVVRRAFPSYFPAETVTLPGTTAIPSRGSGGGGGGGGGSVGKGVGSSSAGKQVKGKGRDAGDAPGSKSDLAKVLGDGKLFIASRVGDVNAVASSLKVKADSLCWPVLFSTKKGDAALSLCPCPDKHGGRNSQWHKAPAGFDRDKLFKKHFSAASAEQLKEAGWRNIKKSKI